MAYRIAWTLKSEDHKIVRHGLVLTLHQEGLIPLSAEEVSKIVSYWNSENKLGNHYMVNASEEEMIAEQPQRLKIREKFIGNSSLF